MTPRIVALVVFAGVLVACGQRGASPASSSLIVAYPGTEGDMNPAVDGYSKFLVFLPLVAIRADGELEGRLARSWEHSPDWREWTFHLRSDVRWHDGVPVTARDVEFTFALLASPEVDEITSHAFEAVTVQDDSTFTVRTGDVYGFTSLIWEVCLPKHLLQGLALKDIAAWKFWLHPVGDGPYRFLRQVPKTLMEFEANPDYYRGKPRIERVVLRFLGNAGLAELLSGGVDVLYATSPTNLRLLAKDPRFRVYTSCCDDTYGIFWNNRLPLFQDSRVRRALTLAIDRQELRQVLDFPPTIPVVDGPYTDRQLRRGDLPTPVPHDTARARALLEEAGWSDTDGDGVRERDGRPFRFTAIVSAGPGRSALAVYVQEQLRRVGVHMEIQPVERGRPSEGDFDAIIRLMCLCPDGWRREFGDSSSTGYHNARAAQLLRRLPMVTDPNEDDRIRREVAEVFQTDPPATFFFPQPMTMVAHRRIRGLSSLWRADPLIYMDELWLEDRP